MNDITQKLEYLKWLKMMDIEYYFSARKDSNFLSIMPSFSTSFVRSIPNKQTDNLIPSKNDILDEVNTIDKLRELINNFTGCRLKDFATNTVFADGISEAKIMLIGEAPGAKEDEKGIPFCGESGILLDTMLATIGLSRKENIYITNTVFWRPPANRTPTKEEKESCKPFLEKHIALVNPKLLICIGSTAVTGLLGDKVTINEARNNTNHYQNKYLSNPINTMAIFHPAYLLRQPAKKKDSWFDLIKIQQYLQKNGIIK